MQERTASLSSIGRSIDSAATAATAWARVCGLVGDSPTASLPISSMDAGSVSVSVKPSPAASISISRTWTVSKVRLYASATRGSASAPPGNESRRSVARSNSVRARSR
jgi:hypothetical protein